MSLAATTGPDATRLLGLGHYRPATVVTNADLVARGVDTDDAWVRARVGIAERRWAGPDESVVDMAEAACGKALAASGVDTSQIDLVLVATCTMPNAIPNAAPQLATRLGIEAPGAYDINSGCSGFVYALNVAAGAIRTGQARHVLVTGAERFSGWLDMADRSTCVILADGAGAAVVGPSRQTAMGPVVWGSAGEHADTIAVDPRTGFFRQEGQAVYRWAASTLAGVGAEACRRAGIEPSDLAAFVPHQANARIVDAIAAELGATRAVVARDIETSGNTSAASIPLAMSRMMERGEIRSGAPVLLLGFGSGLAYAGQVVLAP